MVELRALLIEWDPSTGLRAGGLNGEKGPDDPKLQCYGWQNEKAGLELRMVEDARDLTVPPYVDTPGVTVLIGKDAINAVIATNFPSKFIVSNSAVFIEGCKEKGVKMERFTDLDGDEIARLASELGIPGIIERRVRLVS